MSNSPTPDEPGERPTRERPADLDVVKDLAISLLKRNSLEDLLWDIADAIGRLPGFEDSVVYLTEGDVLVQRAAYGLKQLDRRELLEPIAIPIGKGIVGTVAQTGNPEIIDDTDEDPRYIRDQYEGRSELAVPVVFEGSVIAVLDTESREVGAYSQTDLEILQTMANVAAPRIRSAKAEKELKEVSDKLAALNLELEERVEDRTRELESANQSISAQRDQLGAILDSMQDGVICFDSRFAIRMISPAALRLTGWNLGECLDHDVRQVFSIDQDWDAFVADADTPSHDSALKDREGLVRDVRWTVGLIQREKESEYVLVFSDITKQKQLAKQMELGQRIDSLGILAGGIAHDFNNSLTAIQSSLDSLTIRGGAETEDALTVSQLACDTAKSLANQLLVFSKGGAPIRRSVSLLTVLQRAVLMSVDEGVVQVEWKTDVDAPYIFADESQMTQVFCNLFINAVQAMGGAGTITVEVREGEVVDGQRMVHIWVWDRGPGISTEAAESVFEPYFTTKTNGTGLGLTTSFFIVKRHGGRLHLENYELGCVARVLIPQAEPDVAPQPEPPTKQGERQLRILILEDESIVREGMTMLIESLGHEVLPASDGDEALSVFRTESQDQRSVDFAILDLRINGGRGGSDVLPEIREIMPDTKCIVCSGYSGDPVMSQHRQYGFDAVLPKPFKRMQLATILEELQ
ncbi:MAG: GAF domain-containing protein [Planctomycetota bacterium]